jgi:hypothetical protein
MNELVIKIVTDKELMAQIEAEKDFSAMSEFEGCFFDNDGNMTVQERIGVANQTLEKLEMSIRIVGMAQEPEHVVHGLEAYRETSADEIIATQFYRWVIIDQNTKHLIAW